MNVLQLTTQQHGGDIHHWRHSPFYSFYTTSIAAFVAAGFVFLLRKKYTDASLLFVQAYLSYKSDVETLGVQSKWHLVDRYYATMITLRHFYMLHRSRLPVQLALFSYAWTRLLKSQERYANHEDEFLLEHAYWHWMIVPVALTHK